jgi:hypothetical protein
MNKPMPQHPLAVRWTAILAILAASATSDQAQVTFQEVTNGLVDYYPLDSVSGTTTYDIINRRDLSLVNMTSNNIVSGSHPGMGSSTNVINLTQSPGPTLLVYQSTGQNPLTGGGDFLPFINQRGATMNFWIKGPVPSMTDLRVFAECADNGDSNPFFSLSDQPASKTGLGTFLRLTSPTTDPNGATVNQFSDGTYQTPAYYYEWSQSSLYCTNTIFDNNWHMFTLEIATNGDVHCFVDGNYDPGSPGTDDIGHTNLDNEGNRAITPPLNVTNTYYMTNIYPAAGVSNPPPNGFVRWMVPGLNQAGVFTAFGGFERNGGISAGAPCQMSDIGFWNRTLTTNELQWLMTNGLQTPWPTPVSPEINQFYPDFGEVGVGDGVNIHWNVTGASSAPGGIVISGIGDVSSTPVGSTNITLPLNQTYMFTLTAHNGIVADRTSSFFVKTFAGVPSDWHLIQRFDGLFTPTTQGINGNGWVSLPGTYLGPIDRFNVVTVNGNEVLSPKSGYVPDTNSPVGWDSTGALTYGLLNGLSIPPYQANTLFFRFSLRDPKSLAAAFHIYSGLDFKLGVTDFGFATGPLAGANPPNNYTVGPGIHISRYDPTGYTQVPFDLEADNYNGSEVVNSYSFIADSTNGNPNGLQTNVNYMAWLDISNNNTQPVVSGTNYYTTNEPVFGFWLQAQGQAAPVQLFSGFGGDRDYSTAGQNNDYPTPYLNKIFASVGTEAFQSGQFGAFFETNNMIVLDDFYLSKTGCDHTIPRLFRIASIARGPTYATITWESLGSMFQINTYSIQRTFGLTPAAWTTVATGVPSGGDFTSYTDNTVGANDTVFYRIVWP